MNPIDRVHAAQSLTQYLRGKCRSPDFLLTLPSCNFAVIAPSRLRRDFIWEQGDEYDETTCLRACVCACRVGALAGEWGAWQGSNSAYVAAGIEQDGAALIVICDTERMRISLGFEEPHARWQKGARMDVVIVADGTNPLPPSLGVVIESTRVIIENDANWRTLGEARRSVAITVGDYLRIFPVANLRKAVGPVSHACGEHW